jgi:predicted HTH domain antitoxin
MAMEQSKLKVGINPKFLPFLKEQDRDSVDEDVNLSVAIYLFTAKKVTLARAAELSGRSISDFVQILIDHGIHWAEYTEDHKQQDNETIEFILGNHNSDDKSDK